MSTQVSSKTDSQNSMFGASAIAATVKTLKFHSNELAEALSWIEDQSKAAPLEAELRIISATLAAINIEYGPGYFGA